jgi:hypothetical protein
MESPHECSHGYPSRRTLAVLFREKALLRRINRTHVIGRQPTLKSGCRRQGKPRILLLRTSDWIASFFQLAGRLTS